MTKPRSYGYKHTKRTPKKEKEGIVKATQNAFLIGVNREVKDR